MVRRPTLKRARSIIRVMVAMSAKPLLTCLAERFVKVFVFMDSRRKIGKHSGEICHVQFLAASLFLLV